MAGEAQCGIVLVNTGTVLAPTKKEVRRFTKKFLKSDRIAPINSFIWNILVSFFIVPSRARKSVAKYKLIWTEEGSPLAAAHEKLEFGLNRILQVNGFTNAIVKCAMCFSEPGIEDVLLEMKKSGCTQLIVLPLFPQSSYSTTGDVHDRFYGTLKKLQWDIPCYFIDNYHDNPTYARAIAASIRHVGFNPDSDDRLMTAFHSIPLSDIEQGDTYEHQVGASGLLIANNLGIDRDRWSIAYQSRFKDGRKWLSPFSDEVLYRWAELGPKRIFYVCPGFSVDCLETLYDVEHEIKPAYYDTFARQGHFYDPEFIYVPCLDNSKAHVTVLYDVLHPYLEEIHRGEQ